MFWGENYAANLIMFVEYYYFFTDGKSDSH